MSNRNPKHNVPLPPSRFAFGGGTKSMSELMFNKYDKDKNGSISRSELLSLCYDLGYYLSNDELNWAWTIMDKDGSGTIDYREFAQWWKSSSRFEHLKMPDENETRILYRVVEIFRSYDRNNTGTLDRTQFNCLREILIQEGILNIKEHQTSDFDQIDLSHDGKINFNELIAWFKNIGILNNQNY